jgi:hypothetical protein
MKERGLGQLVSGAWPLDTEPAARDRSLDFVVCILFSISTRYYVDTTQ